ncbi:DUF6314 family protein [Streptomyces sp. NPDC003697]
MEDFWPVSDVLAHLAGSWRVERTVRDLATGDEGRFTGTTVFTPLPADRLPQDLPEEPPGDPRAGRRPHGLPGGPRTGRPQDPPGPRYGLVSRESGTFVWRGVRRPAERTLLFLRAGPPGTAEVRFADGRPFHDLDLRSGRHVADHPCAADLYRGEFTVRDRDHWRTVWRVRGPAKDLVLTTDYAREG